MKYKFLLSLSFLIFFTVITKAQDMNNRWAIGLGAGSVLYSAEDAPKIGFRYVQQFPRFSVARYMFKNVTFAGHLSSSVDKNKKYTTLDADLRYDFGTSENTLSMYAVVGGSLIDTKFLLPLIHIGGGGTWWISDKFGLNGQMTYRINNNGFASQASHLFASGSLVFRFDFNGGGTSYSKSRGSRGSRRRIWQMRH